MNLRRLFGDARGLKDAHVLLFFSFIGTSLIAFPVLSGDRPKDGATITATTGGLPALPVVARPPAMQPLAGLPGDTHLDKTPPRATKGLDLLKAGWTYNCVECHKLLTPRWHYDDRPINEHRDIRLEHGENRFCLNCHHPSNRGAFVDYDGSEIAQTDAVKLCAKCHGTTYRDWKAGAHGRPNGFWNLTMGPRTKLACIQCHDPHSPAFKPLKPLPPLTYPARAARPQSQHGGRKDQHEQ